MSECCAFKRDGSPCRGVASGGRNLCPAHDPGRAEERRRNAKKGGHAKGRVSPREDVAQVKTTLRELVAAVLHRDPEKRIARPDAIAAGQLLNSLLRAIEVERKIVEDEELMERVRALEERAEQEAGGRTR